MHPHDHPSRRRAGDAPAALAAAAPGDTLCFSGGDLAAADMTMTRSGTVNAPIRLVADGAMVHSIQITADHVVLEGFTVASGDGVLLKGTGITARRNTIHDDTQRSGSNGHPTVDIDDSSRPGSRLEANNPA